MRWDGKAYADIVKKSVYAILFSTEIPQAATMGNKEYAAFLKVIITIWESCIPTSARPMLRQIHRG